MYLKDSGARTSCYATLLKATVMVLEGAQSFGLSLDRKA